MDFVGKKVDTFQFHVMKISFDFDGVLDTEDGQEFIRALLNANRLAGPMGRPFDICIVTTRFAKNDNSDLNSLAAELSCDAIFTNHEWKWETLEKLQIDLHIDDNPDEVHLINEKCTKCQALLFGVNIHKLLMEGTEL